LFSYIKFQTIPHRQTRTFRPISTDDHIIQLDDDDDDDEIINDNQNLAESFDNDNSSRENVNERENVIDKKRYVSYYCCYYSSTVIVLFFCREKRKICENFQRCSTAISACLLTDESLDESFYDDSGESLSSSSLNDSDDYETSEFACDPYESYDWEC
jgi:hypothetical protein